MEYQDVPSKTFCPTVPRNFVGKSFSVSPPSGAEEVWTSEGGGQYQDFPSKKILSHSAEKSSKGTLKSFTNFGNRKNFCSRGLCHDFRFAVEIFLSHSAKKFRR